jgi:PIN domain nuclease of toxin-antitoxin system
VRLLLDTHIFLWAASDPARLTEAMRAAIAAEANAVFVSAATAWEIAIKVALGRLTFPLDRFETMLASMGFAPLMMTVAHGIAAGSLPRHHGDPFDRMLIAQARVEGLTLITTDRAFGRYAVAILG